MLGALDNVTHSLVGYALARAPALRDPNAQRAALVTSIVASNAPDLDYLARSFAHNKKLAYLLQHRGYTHTLVCALPAGMAIGALAAFLLRARGAERSAVIAIGALAAFLHIAFDALNNYGVHPFFPIDNHWYYGDALFIVEPLLLAVLLPLLARRGGSRFGRFLGRGLCVLLLAVVSFSSITSRGVALATFACLALAWWAQREPSARVALFAALGVCAAFGVCGVRAKRIVGAELARVAPDERKLQLIATPMPGDPLCWNGLALSLDRGDVYHARFYRLSLAPSFSPRSHCGPRSSSPTAPLEPLQLPSDARFAFSREFRAPASELRRLRREHCDAAAMLRFLRAPFWIVGGRTVLGDLRYDNAPSLEFAELELDGVCRDPTPPWVPPLAALLGH